jgi:hypothetical protein
LSTGSTIPTGPSANQDATRNQKQFISRLGADDQITDGVTKGEASQVISDAKASGATNNTNGNSSSNSGRSSGAAPEYVTALPMKYIVLNKFLLSATTLVAKFPLDLRPVSQQPPTRRTSSTASEQAIS